MTVGRSLAHLMPTGGNKDQMFYCNVYKLTVQTNGQLAYDSQYNVIIMRLKDLNIVDSFQQQRKSKEIFLT